MSVDEKPLFYCCTFFFLFQMLISEVTERIPLILSHNIWSGCNLIMHPKKLVDLYSHRTRSSANAEEPCEHTVSCNHVKCWTNVQWIAFEKICNRWVWVTFKVIQGHCRCWHLIGHILFPIFHCRYVCVLHRFQDTKITCHKMKMSRDLDHAHLADSLWQALLGPVCA